MFVLDFGSKTLEPTWSIILDIIGDENVRWYVLPKESWQSHAVQSVELDSQQIRVAFEAGQYCLVEPGLGKSGQNSILAHAPKSCEHALSQWHVCADTTLEFALLWFRNCLATNDLDYVAIYVDDDPDYEGIETLDVDTFPWDYLDLIKAAVRRPDGRWDQRPGPAPGEYPALEQELKTMGAMPPAETPKVKKIGVR